jgi:hypothetical protein
MIARTASVCIAAALAAWAVEIPAGTEIQVRLETPLSASTAKPDQPVDVVVIRPVIAESGVIVPAGAKISGEVKEAKPPKPGERAQLLLDFDKITGPGGKSAKLDAEVAAVDNAREMVDNKGNIIGILASETLTARMDAGINKVAERYPGFADVLQAIKGGVVKEADPDIKYDAGVEMTLKLSKALKWTPAANSGPQLRGIEPAEELVTMVNAQAFRTTTADGKTPSDVTNLMFLGTEEQIEAAFQAAGWSEAQKLSGQSKLETVRAVIEGRGYKEAPVSILMLDGRPPDLVFQKQNNTFAQRHHLRIWRRPGDFQGRQIWVCAATHDTGIDFSPEQRTFIHKIDPEIDRERAKVVNDLLFTGKVTGLALVDRPDVPRKSKNGTGDDLITDSRMAVLEF